MQSNIPKLTHVLTSLLRADFTTQWRNRRAVIMVIIVPVIIAISWKGLVDKFGGLFILSNCITIGLNAIGLMGYANAIARDRDKGIFQRLRVSPIPTWTIMISRLVVQLMMILLVTTAVFLIGHFYDHITLDCRGYALGYLAAILGGAVYLGLGQAIVGRISNAETVNSTTRLVYFLFIMIGMFGDLGVLGKEIGDIVKWSPYGAVKHLISGSLQFKTWDQDTTFALLLTVLYTSVFSVLGIRWFKWNTK